MGLRGSVRAFSLEQLFQFLSASGHRGTLSIQHMESKKVLYLHQGGLFFERSNWSFRLGDALVRRAEITAGQLDEALETQKRQGGTPRLGDVLVELGHTTRERILAARRFQVEEEIYEVFGWEDGFYEFHKDVVAADLEQRLAAGDPEEFRFDVNSLLMEAARRLDEWHNIRESLPSEKRLLVLSEKEEAWERVTTALVTAGSRASTPDSVFNGRTTVGDLPRVVGLSRFEARSLVTRLVRSGDLRPLGRSELENRFRVALESDLPYAVALYECALESPEFETRGRFLDRVLFGCPQFRQASQTQRQTIGAHMTGKRAFEMLLGLFRQAIPCEYTAREEGQTRQLGLSKSTLVWRVPEGQQAPNIVKHLLARNPIADADMARAREMQRETGRPLQQILVGGGFVTMDNWFRAQKDTVLAEIFGIFFLRRPFVELHTGELQQATVAGQDIDMPLLPWLHAEVMREIRQWETMLGTIPSVRAIFQLTPKGEKSITGPEDLLNSFDGRRSLEEILKTQHRAPHEFFSWVYERVEAGRLQAIDPDDYKVRVEEALVADQRGMAISRCLAAIESNAEAPWFRERLQNLQAIEAEIAVRSARHVLRGDLASFSLAEVLQSFFMNKRSGTLRVEVKTAVEQKVRQIYFERGDVYLLAGDDKELTDGDVSDEQLIGAGNLTEDQLAGATATQMKDEVYEMFLWEGADFEFSADHLPPEFYASSARRKVRLKTTSFLMEAVRRISEWEEVRKVLPSDDLVLAFASGQHKMEAIQLQGQEDLLLLVDGRHPIADLVRISGKHRFRALALFSELVRSGHLQAIDKNARRDADEAALVSSQLPTSGVIDPGFVGQLQFVGTLQDLASAGLTGVLRLTDGRRSKEMALIEGKPYRTTPFRGKLTEGNGALPEVSARDVAQDVSECFSWQGTRFELLQGTLPPRLADTAQRVPFELHPDTFFDAFAQAAERWGLVAELVPRERPIAFTGDEVKDKARRLAGERADLVDLIDGKRSPEDIARVARDRFAAMSWIAACFEEGIVEAVDPTKAAAGGGEEEWDLSL